MPAHQGMSQLVQRFGDDQCHDEPAGGVNVEERPKVRQALLERAEFEDEQADGAEHQQHPTHDRERREHPAAERIESIDNRAGGKARQANCQWIAECREQAAFAGGLRATGEHIALPRRIGNDQAELVQAENERVQLLRAETQWGELPLEALADVVQRRAAVEHFQDRAFLVAQAKKLQRHRVVDHPVAADRAAMRGELQILSHLDFEHAHFDSTTSVACIPGRSLRSGFSTSAHTRT
jgi:hypothetical protein